MTGETISGFGAVRIHDDFPPCPTQSTAKWGASALPRRQQGRGALLATSVTMLNLNWPQRHRRGRGRLRQGSQGLLEGRDNL
jgi:hypothetical protein